jgi:hypothetical protein
VKISLIVEGRTEKVFLPHLRDYLKQHLSRNMPRIDPVPFDGTIPQGGKLKRIVMKLLSGKNAADHVVALTDVYTGMSPPQFKDAATARAAMRDWVGKEPRFHPHAAQYDFEAWLLPYWPSIQKLAGHNKKAPPGNPENVNHNSPPAYRIKEIFEVGTCRGSYVKPRDAGRILKENDLAVAVSACEELKALVNTILGLCGGHPV